MSEELYEQILRKCRIDYIKNEANFKDVARSLSWRLRELLKHFLGSNSLPNTGQDWDDDLAGMFLNALMLKAKITVLSGRYDFRAPALDDLFNGKTMEVEERAATREGWTVLIAFFPALVRILEPPSGMEDGKEVTIVPATVLLQ